MFRPKSATGSRSFLDDLLGNDDTPPPPPAAAAGANSSAANQRQRKSVRFFDEDEDDDGTSATKTSRPHSSTLDSLLSSTTPRLRSQDTVSASATGTRTAKSDWLGLDDDDDNGANLRKSASSAPTASRSGVSLSQLQSQISTPKTTAEPDWLTSGLKARQTTSVTTKESPAPWQPKLLDSTATIPKVSDETIQRQPVAMVSEISSPSSTISQTSPIVPDPRIRVDSTPQFVPITQSQPTEYIPQQQQPLQANTVLNIAEQIAAKLQDTVQTEFKVDSNSTVYLQTQLRMMTLEKSFLDKTIEQMKSNHQEELNSMVSLYEQQMRLTSEMYKRHEDMIQEERERRITELNSQLEHVEKEMESMRSRFQERLATVENDWKSDVTKIRDSNSISNKRLIEEHEQELARLEHRLKSENDDSIQSTNDLVQRQSKTIAELLARWEQSAHKIEQLQRSVIVRQEELARQQSNPEIQDDVLSRKFSDIESQWKGFVSDMEQQRIQFVEVIQSEKEKNSEEISMKIEQQRNQLESEKKEFEMVRQQFAEEVNQWRQQETIEADRMRKERDKLREDVMLFEERRSMLETLYSERNQMLQEEQSRTSKQAELMVQRQTELDQQQSQLKKAMLTLETEQQLLQHKKLQFNNEKDNLNQLGVTLSKRAEELEKLSEVALKEKMDGIEAIDEMDCFRSEIQSKMATIENTTAQMRKEEKRLMMERAQLEQQWMMVKELKESIVCNLCGTALSRARYPPAAAAMSNYSVAMFSNQVNNYGNPNQQQQPNNNTTSPMFYGLLNNGGSMGYMRPMNNAAGMRTVVGGGGGDNQQLFNNNNHSTKTSPDNIIRLGDNDDNDEETKLLFWQMVGQRDAASLAEETNFVQMLTKSQQLVNRVSSKR